jgi:hypothetical protein
MDVDTGPAMRSWFTSSRRVVGDDETYSSGSSSEDDAEADDQGSASSISASATRGVRIIGHDGRRLTTGQTPDDDDVNGCRVVDAEIDDARERPSTRKRATRAKNRDAHGVGDEFARSRRDGGTDEC